MKNLYIGIDVGLNGGICSIDENGKIFSCIVMPTIEIIVNKKKKNQYDIQAINNHIRELSTSSETCSGLLERLRPMPQQSSQSGFSLGYGSAVFETLFTTYGIRFEKIEPRVWQKAMFIGHNYTSEQTKIVSIEVAKQLAPGHDWRATERCKIAHDGKTDAFCIATYSKNVNKC